MNIGILVKQVPSTETLIQIASDGVSIKTDDIKWVMNPYDELAVEEALQIRETFGGTVTIFSMGPKKTEETIRTALAMGADKGVLINDTNADGSDAIATAKVLAAAIKETPFDLIIAGQRAVDTDNYQVASGVAEYLDIPQITQVIKEEISDGKIKCQCLVEGGSVVVEAYLPALITTQRGLNEPRYASLPGIMKAKKKPIDIKNIADVEIDSGSVGSANRKVKITGMKFPPERVAVTMIESDTAQTQAAELVKILHEEAKVI